MRKLFLQTTPFLLPFFLLPLLVFAQPSDFSGLIDIFINVVKEVAKLFILLSILVFFWGIAKFILNTGGGKEQEEAKNIMVWGIIALFVMTSVWGIIRLLQVTFGVS